MKQECPVCRLAYFRESGYYLGAMFLNFIVSAMLLVPFYFLLLLVAPKLTDISTNSAFPGLDGVRGDFLACADAPLLQSVALHRLLDRPLETRRPPPRLKRPLEIRSHPEPEGGGIPRNLRGGHQLLASR